jgi:hydroxyacylglutathione hydrolase
MRRLSAVVLCALVCAAVLLQSCAGARPAVSHLPRGTEVVQLKLSWSNVWLLKGPQPALIDAGSPGELPALEAALAAQGLRVEDLRLIILTHGHADHAGLAARLRARSGAKVIAGAGDVAMLAAGRNTPLRPTRWTAALLGLLVPGTFDPLAPDIAVAERFDLSAFGYEGEVLAMPGHTPGAVAVVLEGSSAFVGDQILGGSFGGAVSPTSPQEHYFHDDVEENLANVAALLERGVSTLYLGHGGPVTAEAVREAFGERLRARP